MINFQELEIEVNERYSFVGIQNKGSQSTFYLPKGFNPDSFTTYESKRNLFFTFYRVLSKFKDICFEKDDSKVITKIQTADRDGVIRTSGSTQTISLPNDESKEIIFYSKLDFITSILDAYDEPKILSLAYRLGSSEKVDYSKIHLFLHRAIYLNNGVAYVDSMTVPRIEVHFQATDIVGMYCYILVEVKQQLCEEVSSEITTLAEQFKHRYVGAEYSLFNEKHSSQIVDTLKDGLELIDKNTPLKDADFWYYYEIIELFLYAELSQIDDGEIWGINNFCDVWESMCLTYLVKTIPPENILYLDIKLVSNSTVSLANSKPKLIDLTNVFKVNGNELIPDAVIINNFANEISLKTNNIYYLRQDINKHAGTLWDDNGYKTACYCKLSNSHQETWIRIAYKGQPSGKNHTFTELEKFSKSSNDKLVINSQLPINFYSFWEIDINNMNNQLFDFMFQLNHIFYMALSQGIFTENKFQDFFLSEFGINFQQNYFSTSGIRVMSYNVFGLALFREYTEKNKNETKLFNDFKVFSAKLFSKIKIIDAKYFSKKYLYERNNFRYIKEESIRKQFVYEYLLQKAIKDNTKEISSSFWIPSWNNNDKVINEKLEYLNNYIELEAINFSAMINNYLIS